MTIYEQIILSIFVGLTSFIFVYWFSIVFNKRIFSLDQFFKFVSVGTIISSTTGFIALRYTSSFTMLIKTLVAIVIIFLLCKFMLDSTFTLSLLTPLMVLFIIATSSSVAHITISIFKVDYLQAKESFYWSIIPQIIVFFLCITITFIIDSLKIISSLPRHRKSRALITLAIYFALVSLSILLNFSVFSSPNSSTTHSTYYMNALVMLSLLVISIYNTTTFFNLEKTSEELKYHTFYNETLQNLLDDIRSFKHNYNNVIEIIRSFTLNHQWDALEEYINELTSQNTRVNQYDAVINAKIKNAALFALVMNKLAIAVEKNVYLNVRVNNSSNCEIDSINMKVTDFTEILSVFLDNAIEAASESAMRFVELIIEQDNEFISFIVKNSANNKPDVQTIYKKDISSKGSGRGFGLWVVSERLKKYKNVCLNTSIEHPFMTQELIIEQPIIRKKIAS